MARSARSTRSIPAAAWFYSQSFHSSPVPAPVQPAPVAALEGLEGLETIDPRELMMDALEDERLIADRDLERELDYRADREGDACGSFCGYCGRCS
jgi:hypothetical protein